MLDHPEWQQWSKGDSAPLRRRSHDGRKGKVGIPENASRDFADTNRTVQRGDQVYQAVKPRRKRPEPIDRLVAEAEQYCRRVTPAAICPMCKQPVKPLDLRVSLEHNQVERWGKTINLGPQEAEILAILHQRWPLSASPGYIVAGLYGSAEWPDNPRNVLRVKISRNRRLIGSLGVTIDAPSRRGYRIELHDEPIGYACAASRSGD
jgi:hypothetical protein